MKLNAKLRAGLLIVAMAATLGAVRWADKLGDADAANARGVANSQPRDRQAKQSVTKNVSGLDLERLQRGRDGDPDSDPFGPRSFRPPPPKPKPMAMQGANGEFAQAPPPPPPQAPPLPFAYMGKLAEDRNTTVFLTAGDRNLVVKPGDVIDNTYRLEEVTDSAVVLTYLPMNQRQQLAIGVQ
jgi:hypothetical protein